MIQNCSLNHPKSKSKTAVIKAIIRNMVQFSRGLCCVISTSLSAPTKYARKLWAIIRLTAVKRIHVMKYLMNFSPVQGDFARFICFIWLPMTQYSIRLKTPSINTVCGQAHPHQTLPHNAVIKPSPIVSVAKIKKIRGLS